VILRQRLRGRNQVNLSWKKIVSNPEVQGRHSEWQRKLFIPDGRRIITTCTNIRSTCALQVLSTHLIILVQTSNSRLKESEFLPLPEPRITTSTTTTQRATVYHLHTNKNSVIYVASGKRQREKVAKLWPYMPSAPPTQLSLVVAPLF
jgi:hypothetical protein